MSYQKIADIITKVYERTNANLVEWEATEQQNKFQVSFANYSLRISVKENSLDPDDNDYIIYVINSYGEIVEEVSDEDLRQLLPDAFMKMKSIYELARRKAMGVDYALDSILDELNGEIPF